MNVSGSLLCIYVPEGERHRHDLVWEWLLERANAIGIRGGSAFKAIAGFGRHRTQHEASFFELAGALVVKVEFIVTDDEAERLLTLVRQEKIRVFYARVPSRFGVINPDPAEPAGGASDE